MTLKTSFASVLRALRGKRNISQRDFADTTSRTYLSKLELGKSSITLDKLDQISKRLQLSPLTLLTLTIAEETEQPVIDLITKLQQELADLQRGDGLPNLRAMRNEIFHNDSPRRDIARRDRTTSIQDSAQAELAFVD